MRDPKRIPKMMAILQEGWNIVPDWRFGQLIENFKRYIGRDDLFHIEDDEMIKLMRKYFGLDQED